MSPAFFCYYASQMFTRRAITSISLNVAVFGGVLFLSAGTWRWWRAWVFLGVLTLATVVIMFTVFRQRQDLLRERFKGLFQKGQPWADRLVMLLFLISYGML